MFVAGDVVKILHRAVTILLGPQPLHVLSSAYGRRERFYHLLRALVDLEFLGFAVVLSSQQTSVPSEAARSRGVALIVGEWRGVRLERR